MEAIKSCIACAGAGKRLHDAAVLCGSLTPVVYIPVPVFAAEICSECHKTCGQCGSRRDAPAHRESDTGERSCGGKGSTQDDIALNQNAVASEESVGRFCCVSDCRNAQNLIAETKSNHFCGLQFCVAGVGHLRSADNHAAMLHPNRMMGCGHGHGTSQNGRPEHAEETRSTEKEGDDARLELLPTFDGAGRAATHRKLSADSGRVTWSDSGESLYSDIQGGDSLRRRRASAVNPKTCAPTSPSKLISAPAFQTMMSCPAGTRHVKLEDDHQSQEDISIGEATSSIRHGRGDGFSYPISAARFMNNTTSSRSLKMLREPDSRYHRFSTCQSPRESHEVEIELERQRSFAQGARPKQTSANGNTELLQPSVRKSERRTSHFQPVMASPCAGPRRTQSETVLRKATRRVSKCAGTKLDCLAEDNFVQATDLGTPPRRPRSRSLFATSKASLGFLTPTQPLQSETPNFVQHHDTDFTSWGAVVRNWEVGGESSGKDSVKVYGLAAVPSLDGIAITDAGEVKIHIYGIDGEKRASFFTGTWPRHGRGVTLTPDRRRLAACHLSEVRTYTLKGDIVNHVNLGLNSAFWGIAVNVDGNFVMTDPKSSSVVIMSPGGQIMELIGGNPPKRVSVKETKSRKSARCKKSKNHKSVGGSNKRKTLAANEETDDGSVRRSSSDISLPAAASTSRGSDLGTEGKAKVRLLAPRYVAVNSKNQILVTDTKQRSLVVFENDGTFLFSIGGGRMGCRKCNYSEADKEKDMADLVSATECWNLTAAISPIDRMAGMTRNTSDPGISSSSEKSRSQPLNYFSEICSSGGSCIGKNRRPKAIGALRRSDVGRNESVESEAYQDILHHGAETSDSRSTRDQSEFSPSRDVGVRLRSYGELAQCSSCFDLPTPDADKESSMSDVKSRLRKMAKGIKRPAWMRGHGRKEKKVSMSQISRCESLASLSVAASLFDGANAEHMTASFGGTVRRSMHQSTPPLSSREACPFTPVTKVTTFSYETFNGRSEPASPQDWEASCHSRFSPVRFRSSHTLSEFEYVTSYDDYLEAGEEGNDAERIACRRCHVEDPRGVCVDSDDNILLLDRARHRVTVFTPEGHFVRHVLTEDDGLNQPMSVCVLNNSSIAITDSSLGAKIFQFGDEFTYSD